MGLFERISSALSTRGEPIGKQVARSGQQLAAHPPAPQSAATNGDSGARDVAEAPPNSPGLGARALGAVASGFAKGIALEQLLSKPFSAIPFPGFPALCVGDPIIGVPHAHAHPPNLTPPNPVPVPLPSIGPVLDIPFVSGAKSTLIEGRHAARCGDLGASIFCGGLFPLAEIFLGSSSVWVEGARQARGVVDITKHCIFSTPKPNDPPIGPALGMTVPQCQRTLIGGVPMPSLMAMAMGAAFKGLFKGLGRVLNRLKGKTCLLRFLRKATIHGDEAFQRLVKQDLSRMSRTAMGRQILNRITRAKHGLDICPPNTSAATAIKFCKHGPHCETFSKNAHVNYVPDPDGPYVATFADGSVDKVSVTGRGSGGGSRVVYDPKSPNSASPGTPSDVALAHELNHASNNATGQNMSGLRDADPDWNKNWKNHEEHNTVAAENAYREQRGGVPQRSSYRELP